MTKGYKPTWLVDAIYDITPAQLKKHGIRAVFADLDNTLIAWNNPDGTAQLHDWIKLLKDSNIPIVVISNNKASRVHRAVSNLGLPYISRAMKPFTRGINQALKQLDLKPNEAVMVGDQLMTDMKAGNACGVPTILVKPLVETDAWNTRINRFIEGFVMKKLATKYPEMKWSDRLNGKQ